MLGEILKVISIEIKEEVLSHAISQDNSLLVTAFIGMQKLGP